MCSLKITVIPEKKATKDEKTKQLIQHKHKPLCYFSSKAASNIFALKIVSLSVNTGMAVRHFQPSPNTYTWKALAFKWASILNVGISL